MGGGGGVACPRSLALRVAAQAAGEWRDAPHCSPPHTRASAVCCWGQRAKGPPAPLLCWTNKPVSEGAAGQPALLCPRGPGNWRGKGPPAVIWQRTGPVPTLPSHWVAPMLKLALPWNVGRPPAVAPKPPFWERMASASFPFLASQAGPSRSRPSQPSQTGSGGGGGTLFGK